MKKPHFPWSDKSLWCIWRSGNIQKVPVSSARNPRHHWKYRWRHWTFQSTWHSPPLFQVLILLRFYARGAFQDMDGELIGDDQLTISHTLQRATDALLWHVPQWVINKRQKYPWGNCSYETEPQMFLGASTAPKSISEYEHEFMNLLPSMCRAGGGISKLEIDCRAS